MDARNLKSTPEDKYKFVAFVLSTMKLRIEHGKTKKKDKEKRVKEKRQEIGDPKMHLFTLEVKEPLFNYAETAMWHASGSVADSPRGQSTKVVAKDHVT